MASKQTKKTTATKRSEGKLYAEMMEVDTAMNTAMAGKRADVCIALCLEHAITIARAAGYSQERVSGVLAKSRLWDAAKDELTLIAKTRRVAAR